MKCSLGTVRFADAYYQQRAAGSKPRTVDLSGIQLTVGVASVLSDVFTIEWGLRKLVFKECDLDEHVRNCST